MIANAIDFTKPENADALKALAGFVIFSLGFWALYLKADWVGEHSPTFLSGANGPVTATPGCLLKPFGLISLLLALFNAAVFVMLVWGPQR